MYSETTAPDNQLKAKKDYRKYLCGVLEAATGIYDQLSEKDRAEALKVVNNINRIRYQIYETALGLGYVKACKDAIPVCNGECCIWHYPKQLNCLDLFITVCSISTEEQNALKDQIGRNNGRHQCPVLRENGCSLSFESRPLVCSNAYPCFAGEFFHKFLLKQRKEIDIQYSFLKEIFQAYPA
jgi:hypothetical protein